ncbi:transposase, partial [Chloroflexus sp.]|uniref:transposase n=1 Tax=Chloroflexus sp. TaxID=1904827 RepID=UPI00404B42D9
MNQGYRSKETCVFLVTYQLIWCPKRRRTVLVDRVRTRLEEVIRETASEVACVT